MILGPGTVQDELYQKGLHDSGLGKGKQDGVQDNVPSGSISSTAFDAKVCFSGAQGNANYVDDRVFSASTLKTMVAYGLSTLQSVFACE